jgi:alpha-glucosidase
MARSQPRVKAGAGLDQGRLRIAVEAPGFLRLRFDPQARFADPLSGLPSPDFVPQPGSGPSRENAWQVWRSMGLELRLDPRRLALELCTVSGERLAQADASQRPRARVTALKPAPSASEAPEPDAAPARGGCCWGFDTTPNWHWYGLGEKGGPLDRSGHRFENWNTDAFRYTPATDPLYKSIPFLLASAPTAAGRTWFGLLLDNPGRCVFDLGRDQPDHFAWASAHGTLDAWLLAGPGPAAVLERLAQLTGRPHLPPLWALGYHQSRWGYASAKEIEALAARFAAESLPLDCLHFDIEHMRGHRSFTWDAKTFPNPKQLLQRLAKRGVHATLIANPGLKVDPQYAPYRQALAQGLLVRNRQGKPVRGRVWPGLSVFPDFFKPEARAWWGNLHAGMIAQGVQGVWDDMNEPTIFGSTTLPGAFHATAQGRKSHAEVRNLYGSLMAQATAEGLRGLDPDRRHFVLSRSAYLGVQRHSAVWLGDNTSSFEYLSLGITMLQGMGASGVPFCGVDIGGFDHDADAELLIRWTQAGSLFPFCRNHSTLGSRSQEPFAFGEPALSICRRWLDLRYRLLPYLYTLFAQAHLSGAPILRPLYYEFPDDEAVANLGDQFMLGPSLWAAPVLQAGVRARAVVLPQGLWIERATARRYKGGRAILALAPLADMPLYVRGGSIIPAWMPALNTASRERDKLYLDLYPEPGMERSFTLYEDDGVSYAYERGMHCTWQLRLSCEPNGQRVALTLEEPAGPYPMPYKHLVLRFHGLQGRPSRVLVDGLAWPMAKTPGPGVVHGLMFGHAQARLQVSATIRSVVLEELPGIVAGE